MVKNLFFSSTCSSQIAALVILQFVSIRYGRVGDFLG